MREPHELTEHQKRVIGAAKERSKIAQHNEAREVARERDFDMDR